MNIHILSGIGNGPTKLAAFDAGLCNAGIANYNLIFLSSIIPSGSRIYRHKKPGLELAENWGYRLYVVMASISTDMPREEIWAGLGWVQDQKTGQGLFVEHTGRNERSVRSDIHKSLEAMILSRPGHSFGKIQVEICGVICANEPVAAVVLAAYQASDWGNKPHYFEA